MTGPLDPTDIILFVAFVVAPLLAIGAIVGIAQRVRKRRRIG